MDVRLAALQHGSIRSAPRADHLTGKAKLRAVAEEFESVFLGSMFQNMSTATEGAGPFGGDQSTGVWRSMLTDEYAKGIARAGGVGIADQVYRTLLGQQETHRGGVS